MASAPIVFHHLMVGESPWDVPREKLWRRKNMTNIQAITERVAREGEIPPVGTYGAETVNFLEVRLSKNGTKGISLGFNLKTNKDGSDATGYSMQKYMVWSLTGKISGTSKAGKPYSIDHEENLVLDFARLGFSAADIEAIIAAISDASPTAEEPVAIFGADAPALLNANGEAVVFRGKSFKVTVAHEEYQGRTNARFRIGKAKVAA
jgi:hypothetical protein